MLKHLQYLGNNKVIFGQQKALASRPIMALNDNVMEVEIRLSCIEDLFIYLLIHQAKGNATNMP